MLKIWYACYALVSKTARMGSRRPGNGRCCATSAAHCRLAGPEWARHDDGMRFPMAVCRSGINLIPPRCGSAVVTPCCMECWLDLHHPISSPAPRSDVVLGRPGVAESGAATAKTATVSSWRCIRKAWDGGMVVVLAECLAPPSVCMERKEDEWVGRGIGANTALCKGK